jgi:hypothetical protein
MTCDQREGDVSSWSHLLAIQVSRRPTSVSMRLLGELMVSTGSERSLKVCVGACMLVQQLLFVRVRSLSRVEVSGYR